MTVITDELQILLWDAYCVKLSTTLYKVQLNSRKLQCNMKMM